MTVRRLGLVGGVPLIGLALGAAIAIASSLASLNADRHGETSGFVEPSPRALATPSPTVSAAGLLGTTGRLLTNGSNTIIALGSNAAVVSADAGHTWTVVRPPANASGLAIDPSNPSHAITGGSAIQVTGNGGSNWAITVTPPASKIPYVPIAISPVEPNVWFFVHGTQLLVTRDASASWTEVKLPQLTNVFLTSGQALGQFYLASGNRIFELRNYGQTVIEQPALSSAATDLVAVGGTSPTLLARASGQVYRLYSGAWLPTGRDLRGPIAAGAGGTMLIGNGGERLGVPGAISYSVDGGTSWSAATGLPFDQTVEAISGQFGSRTYFAYCYGGDLYISTDGGRTWSWLTSQLRAG